MLVNEHSASAAEMVAGFRVGIRAGDAGRHQNSRAGLVATSAFKVGFGYRVGAARWRVLHVARHESGRPRSRAARQRSLISTDALRVGEDNQLARAKEEVARI